LVDLNAEAVPHGGEVVGLGKVSQPVVLVNIKLLRLYLIIYIVFNNTLSPKNVSKN
jgi:hypothetical protein